MIKNSSEWRLKEIGLNGEILSHRSKTGKSVLAKTVKKTPAFFVLSQRNPWNEPKNETIKTLGGDNLDAKELIAALDATLESYVILDKKNNTLHHNGGNIIGVKTLTKTKIFIANGLNNHSLYELIQAKMGNLPSASPTPDLKVELSLKEIFNKNNQNTKMKLDLKECSEISIYSNYYQFLTSYDVFNFVNYHKQYQNAITKDPVLNLITQKMYNFSGKEEQYCFNLKRKIKKSDL
jgi:hypothetical protein